MAPYLEVGMDGDRVYFATEDRRVTSRRFRQEPIGPAECNGSQEMEITVCETGERLRIFDSIGPSGEPKTVREFWIEPREAPFMYEGRYLTAERSRVFAGCVVGDGKSRTMVLNAASCRCG